jgi:hypothetical protein
MGPPGHFAIALTAKAAAPKLPLWILLVASEILDLLCFGFIAIGIEHVAPDPALAWSHGLFMSIVWSAIAAATGLLLYRDRTAGILLGLVVLSHWVLDFIAHSPDLPLLFNGSPLVGLGLENSILFGIILEFGMLAAGAGVYFFARKRDRA